MPEPVCPECHGEQYITGERNGVTYAERCKCYEQRRAASLTARMQLPEKYANRSFDDFFLPQNNPQARNALSPVLVRVQRYAKDFTNIVHGEHPGLLLIGKTGVGKTHLAVAALKEIARSGFECVFCDYLELLQQIRAGYDPASNVSARDAYRRVLDADVLMIDDLGAHRVTDWVEDTVTEIITSRCNRNKALIATTNLRNPGEGSLAGPSLNATSIRDLTPTLAERIGARAYSRLYEMCTIINVPDVGDHRRDHRREF